MEIPVLLALLLAARFDVAILQHRFEPDSVRVQPGDTVRWTHADAAAHTVTGSGTEAWGSGHMTYGDTFMKVFSTAGEFEYACLYHPMSGKVFVGGAAAIRPASEIPAARETKETFRDARGRAVKPGNVTTLRGSATSRFP